MNRENIELCNTCGKEISKLASVCPHCGDPKYRGNYLNDCIDGLRNLVIAVVIIWALLSATCSLLFKNIGS